MTEDAPVSTGLAPPEMQPPPGSLAASAPELVEGPLAPAVIRDYVARLRGGDLGALPAVLGFVVLFALFSVTATNFLSTRNFANLLTQAAPVVLIGTGIVFVLLLGEIDLSAGATAGVCAVSMAWLLAHGYSPWLAIPAAVVIGMAIGALTGFLVAKVGIPSFVVTLAFFLSWQGVVLLIAKEGGTIAVTNKLIIAIANKNLSPTLGWLLMLIVVVGFASPSLVRIRARHRAGLPAQPIRLVVGKAIGLAILWGAATYFLNRNRALAGRPLRGVPDAVPLVLVIVVVFTFLVTRTPWGRHIYAVGGNAEAARRAGINVAMIRLSGFVTCSSLAAIGGMALASQLNSVSPQTGGNDTVLLAVAAAVIGGTSLFGGRGRVVNAVIGGLVVALIPNGLGLLGKKGGIDFSSSGPKFITTGLVLLLAASVDALSRKRAQSG
jgi:D-xylose transport system permease protein